MADRCPATTCRASSSHDAGTPENTVADRCIAPATAPRRSTASPRTTCTSFGGGELRASGAKPIGKNKRKHLRALSRQRVEWHRLAQHNSQRHGLLFALARQGSNAAERSLARAPCFACQGRQQHTWQARRSSSTTVIQHHGHPARRHGTAQILAVSGVPRAGASSTGIPTRLSVCLFGYQCLGIV